MKKGDILFVVLFELLAIGLLVQARTRVSGESDSLDQYNVVWRTPSKDSSGSMPIGNGDIGLNVWVEEDGDLLFYIGKTDSWGDNARLLKVGRVRISLSPNPLTEDATFIQTLNLGSAEILVEITSGDGSRRLLQRIWVDANNPVIHVTAESAVEATATATIELWRTERDELPSLEVSDIYLDRSKPDQKHDPTIVEPDTVLRNQVNRIGWYHHNVKSVGPAVTMGIQGLSECLNVDPLLHRTFGGVITTDGGKRVDDLTIQTAKGTSHRFNIYVLTLHPSTPEAWLKAMDDLIVAVERRPFDLRRRAHEAWWAEFWNRSYIRIRESATGAPEMIEANRHPLRLGMDQNGGNRFRGTLGRISVLERVLSEEEIAGLAGGPRETLRGLDGLTGSWANVEPGWAVPDSAERRFTGPLTLEGWVRPEVLPQGGGRIVDKITPGGDDGFLLDTWPGNSLRFITKAGTLQKKDGLTPGQWRHVAVTVNPQKGELKLFVDGGKVAERNVELGSDAFVVSRAYHLQRFINACAGRGHYPIKFNGSIFTVPFPIAPGDADYRRWGPGYWWQNTRLPYIGMCTSGDFDLMNSLFRMYTEELMEVSKFRTKRYFGHEGVFIPECIYFWGAVFSETYGWTPFDKRTEDKLQESRWHKWEWVSGLELTWMMLDYYEHTLDTPFLQNKLLLTANEVLVFFDRHYKTDDRGRLVMHPSQSLETWWDCTNPMPELAGLHAVTRRLLCLPEELTTSEQRAFWKGLNGKLPDLPTREIEGVRMLAPAERFAMKRNIENPELYAVFPFRLFGVGEPRIELATEALEHRRDKGNFGWRQDDIFMAYLGLAGQARTYVSGRARNKDSNSRFPAFWGPNYDWVPDQDHGGVLMKAVQAMLIQSDGRKIYLLPAWPKAWDVEFKVHAPFKTIVEGVCRNGKIEQLSVTPEDRRKDLVLMEPQ
jgi:hypothetical protein